jgi:hypothetical protein
VSEFDPLSAEHEMFVSKKDRVLAEEGIILDGLHKAIQAGWLTQQEADEYLNEYIEKRDAPNS